MGTDRKGPLAAFVVVAIVAAVLLVTSVRSQAAPGFFNAPLPATVMAAPRAATGLLSSIDRNAHQVVHQGVVLAHKAVPSTTDAATVTTASPTAPTVQPPAASSGRNPHHATPGTQATGPTHPAPHGAPDHGPARPPHSFPSMHHGHSHDQGWPPGNGFGNNDQGHEHGHEQGGDQGNDQGNDQGDDQGNNQAGGPVDEGDDEGGQLGAYVTHGRHVGWSFHQDGPVRCDEDSDSQGDDQDGGQVGVLQGKLGDWSTDGCGYADHAWPHYGNDRDRGSH